MRIFRKNNLSDSNEKITKVNPIKFRFYMFYVILISAQYIRYQPFFLLCCDITDKMVQILSYRYLSTDTVRVRTMLWKL